MGEQVAARLYGGVAQLGEHLPCKQGVKSSNLSVSIRWETAAAGRKSLHLEKGKCTLKTTHIERSEIYQNNQKIEFTPISDIRGMP